MVSGATNLEQFKTDCIADRFVRHEMDMRDVQGAEGVIEQFRTMKAAFSDWKIEPQLVLVNGRNVLGLLLATGTHDGELKLPDQPAIAKTGKKMSMLIFHRVSINNENKATEEWTYQEPMSMMAQLGQLPPKSPPVRTAMVKPLPGAPIVVVAADDEKERANIELIKKATDAFNAKKVGGYVALWAADGIEHDLGMPKDSRGNREITATENYYRTAFPDLQLETPDMFAAGDYVVVLGTATGTNSGRLGKMKPTNQKITMHYAEVFRIKNNKIAEVWRVYNGMAFAKQLGIAQMKQDTMNKQEMKQDTMDKQGTMPKQDTPRSTPEPRP